MAEPIEPKKRVEIYEGFTKEELDHLLTRLVTKIQHAERLANFVDWGVLLVDMEFLDPEADARLVEAFSRVKRLDFMHPDVVGMNIHDEPAPIGNDQNISQPSMVAIMLKALDLQPGQSVADIGTGSGYSLALEAHIVGEEGEVDGFEIEPALVDFGKNNLAKYDFPWVSIQQAGSSLGNPSGKLYDRILVSAQIKKEWLPILLAQLSPDGGVLVAPVASEESHERESDPLNIIYDQQTIRVERNGNEYTTEVIKEKTAFVPLVYKPVNGQAVLLAESAISGTLKKYNKLT